jgi:hypothetical protein
MYARWSMGQVQQVTAIIEREGDGYVALCPELDVASQGETVEDARKIFGTLSSYSWKRLIHAKSSSAGTPRFSSRVSR